MSTGASKHPHAALPGTSPKDNGEGRSETDTLKVSSSTTPRNTKRREPPPITVNDARRPLRAHFEWRPTLASESGVRATVAGKTAWFTLALGDRIQHTIRQPEPESAHEAGFEAGS